MGLEKAEIKPLDEKGNSIGDSIKVLFNPAEYSIETSNQFQSTSLPGLLTPITQFVSGNARTLTMDLFFDTYEKGEDVRDYTRKVTSLLEINSDMHAPPLCMFIWGKLSFKATLERVTQRFTLFFDSGVPARSTLNVTFKEFRTITEQLGNPPRQSADRTKRRIIQHGDTLWLIADQEYGDPALWRKIAKANDIVNPRTLTIGAEMKIPPLE